MPRILLALLMLSGCAIFDAPEQHLIVSAGSTVCFGTDAGCKALDRITHELNDPKLTAAICAAGAQDPACGRP